jgi:hypothetical protein
MEEEKNKMERKTQYPKRIPDKTLNPRKVSPRIQLI